MSEANGRSGTDWLTGRAKRANERRKRAEHMTDAIITLMSGRH